jgi:hypothetical protein
MNSNPISLRPFALSEVEVQLPHRMAFDCAQAERRLGS